MFRKALTASVFALTLLSMRSAHASAWETTRAWDSESEQAFSDWIAKTPASIFSNPASKYTAIATDCADAAYALRIIFASENGLPVNFQGTYSNTTTQFDGTPAGVARVKKFINWVNRNTGTESIARDTYPVAITPEYIRPGTLFVHAATSNKNVSITYRSGHVYYLQNVDRENGLITYISSTVPAAVRSLSLRYGISFAPQETTSGYRVWKWSDSNSRPGQSDEQYHLAGWHPGAYGDVNLWDRWQEAIQSRLRSRPINGNEKLQISKQNLDSVLRQRVTAVRSAWAFYQKRYGGQGCMNSTDYENYSTSTRDVKVQEALEDFRSAARGEGTDGYQFQISADMTVGFNELYQTFMTKRVLEISEPEHSPQVRWGLQDQGAWVCPQRATQYVGGNQINPYE